MSEQYRVVVKRPICVEDWDVVAESADLAVAAVLNREDGARLVMSDSSPPETTVIRITGVDDD